MEHGVGLYDGLLLLVLAMMLCPLCCQNSIVYFDLRKKGTTLDYSTR